MFLSSSKTGTTMPLGWSALGAMILGLSVGRIYRPQCLDWFICLALFLMLYPPMLEVDLAEAKRVLSGPKLVIAALLTNFVVSPLLMFGLLHFFLDGGTRHLMPAIILYSMVPGGGMVPAFTGMLRGNVTLSITISTVGIVLSLAVVPLWTECLIGTQIEVPAFLIFRQLCTIILIPLTLALLTRRVISGILGDSAFLSAKARIKTLSGGGLCLLLFSVFLLYGDRVMSEPVIIPAVAGPVSVFLMVLFMLSRMLGKALHSPYEDAIALTLSTMAKNNAISLALAFSTFGPEAALANAIAGPLVQMPILMGFVTIKGCRIPETVT